MSIRGDFKQSGAKDGENPLLRGVDWPSQDGVCSCSGVYFTGTTTPTLLLVLPIVSADLQLSQLPVDEHVGQVGRDIMGSRISEDLLYGVLIDIDTVEDVHE